MLESASDHLVIVFLSIALLFMHLFKMDERVATPSARRLPRRRTAGRTFSHYVSTDESAPIPLIDPDGRITHFRRR
jgi:hypothetical protein